jgi:Type II CAAX prenyl endopeptidase Rce1-like
MPDIARGFGTIVRATAVAFVIALAPQGVWSALILANIKVSPRVPWAVGLMAGLLWAMWRYLGGAFPPRRTSESRRLHLRAGLVPREVLVWALVSGSLSIIALTGYWIVLARFFRMPGSVLPNMANVPRSMAVLAVVTGAAISPICEQIGIWGYGQVILSRDFTRLSVIGLSAVIFAVGPHPPFGVPLLPKIAFFFLVGLAFAVTAALTGSILPNLPVHMLGLLTFFTIVWPNDPRRPLLRESGLDLWFVVHVAQSILFTVLALWAFRHLSELPNRERPSPGR